MRHGTSDAMIALSPDDAADSREVDADEPQRPDVELDVAEDSGEDPQADEARPRLLPMGKAAAAPAAREGDPKAKETFLHKLNQDWAAPLLHDYIHSQEERIRTSLAYENRMAFIGSDGLAKSLANYVELYRLPPEDLALEALPPFCLVLVEGRWLEPANPWRAAVLGTSPDTARPLYRLLQAFRRHSVPIALWLTEEAGAKSSFAHLFPYVDRVFVVAPADQGADATYLPPAVDIKRFNPFKESIDKFRRDTKAIRYVLDGAYEYTNLYSKEECETLVEPLLEYKSWLIDSTYSQRNNNVRLSSALRRRFLGCFLGAGLPYLLRQAVALFLPGAMMQTRPVHVLQRTLEAAASKSIVLTDGVPSEFPCRYDSGFPGVVSGIRGDLLRSTLERLSRDTVARLALQHVAWREAVRSHTYFERLETLFAALNVEGRIPRSLAPSVNVVMPTIRPELVAAAIRTFDRLSYENKHLSIVLNGVSVPPDLARQIQTREDIHLHVVPGYKSIGYCMNTGIDSVDSDYWAKMDDDDIYGPEYLSDLLLQRKYIDFDVSGKAAIFGYFEGEDSMQIRSPDLTDVEYTFLGGGTFLAKNEGRYFPQDVRGYADTLFILDAVERGDLLVAGDPFNFVQVRRADPSSHTWTLGATRVNRQGPTRTGLRFDHVVI